MDENNQAFESARDEQPENDRRAMLEAGLEAAEKGEPIDGRDAQGRFAPKAAQPEQEET
jgi:hypothetical protein